jgi:ribosomal protein S18 acetylase RimI-like enzyme
VDAQVRPARHGEYPAAKRLVEEYVESLPVDLGFQGIERELADFPGAYEPPRGCLLLALVEGRPVGCVAVKSFEEGVCELKRLYVRPEGRRAGLGRKLTEAALEEAARLGYRRMRLDTLPSMDAARSLYRALGFVEIEPYRFNPVPGTAFFERELS